MKHIKVFGISDVGVQREKNEDNFWVRAYNDMAILLVADGMGGYQGGRAASSTIVKTFRRHFGRRRAGRKIDEVLEECLLQSNRRIRELSRIRFQDLTIGSTTAVAIVCQPKKDFLPSRPPQAEVFFTNLGDSRIYHLRDGMIVQKSIDHTMLQRMIEAGALEPKEVDSYAHKNIVYKSLNGDERLESEPIQSFELELGDALLLCSDGLSNFVKPENMVQGLQGTRNLKEAAGYLVRLANCRGGDDNITVLLLEFGTYPRHKSPSLEKLPRAKKRWSSQLRRWLLLPLFALLLAAIGALVVTIKDDEAIPNWLKSLSVRWSQLSLAKSSSEKDKFPVKNEKVKGRELPLDEHRPLKLPAKVLRSWPAPISKTQARDMFIARNFFNLDWNPGGDPANDLEPHPSSRTVQDRATDLVWHEAGSPSTLTREAALTWLLELNTKPGARENDWRLPTLEEAASIIEKIKKNDGLYIDPAFSSVQRRIWTADPVVGESSYFWIVNFAEGSVSSLRGSRSGEEQGDRAFVKPVRRAPLPMENARGG